MSRRPDKPLGKPGKQAETDSRGLTSEDRRIWSRITGSVTPPRARKAARVIPGAAVEAETPVIVQRGLAANPKARKVATPSPSAPVAAIASSPRARSTPEALEPRRHRRLSRERDPIEASIDLHGFGRFEAEDQLRAFLGGCQARGMRSVLVITGQGRLGGGVIRASVHEWLQAPALRSVVSGFAVSHRRHGGDGAIYVTLKPR